MAGRRKQVSRKIKAAEKAARATGGSARGAAKPTEPLVNPFAAKHGHYVEGTVVDLSGELGGRRMAIAKVMLNRGGTAVERWIANDKAGLFDMPQQSAIRWTQNLWLRAEGGLRAIDPTREVIDAPLGWSQQEALTHLQRLKDRVPPRYWSVYENVCRWDEEAGVAGSKIASNSRSAIDAAKTTVAFIASLIAMWERL